MMNRGINPWNNTLPAPDLVPQYRGAWKPVAFETADVVTVSGGFYIAIQATGATDVPGVSAKWEPIVDSTAYEEALARVKTQESIIEKARIDTLKAIGNVADMEKAVQFEINKVTEETNKQRLAVEDMRTVVGIKALGREPTTGDAAGIYRVGTEDVQWNGTEITGRSPAVAAEALATLSLSSLDSLRAYNGSAKTVVITDPVQGGIFHRTDSVTVDDSGNYVVGEFGWKRGGNVYAITSYEGKADYVYDNTISLNNILDSIKNISNAGTPGSSSYSVAVHFPAASGDYYFKTQPKAIEGVNIMFVGDGEGNTRLVADFPGTLFTIGSDTYHSSFITFQDMEVKHPYSVDPVYWRPTGGPDKGPRIGKTLDTALIAKSNGKYELASPNPPEMEKWLLFDAKNCSKWILRNVHINGCYRFANFGGPDSYSSAFYWINVYGFQFNRGLAAVTVYKGAGFIGNIATWFVNAEHPATEELMIDGKPHLFMEKMTTLPGTNVFNIRGHWDTWGIHGSNALFERAWSLYHFNVTPGHAMSFLEHQGVICDYFAGDVIDFTDNRGSVSLLNLGDMRASPIHGKFINIPANSGFMEILATGTSVYMGGQEAINVQNPNLIDLHINGGRFHSTNFLSSAFPYTHPETLAPGWAIELNKPLADGGRIRQPGGGCLVFGEGVKNFRFNDVDINKKPDYGSGTQVWYAAYGVLLGKNTDNYMFANCVVDGQYLGIAQFTPNDTPSTRRRIVGTVNKGVLTLGTDNGFTTTTVPPSGQTWWNTSAYTMAVSVGGGDVTSITYKVHEGSPTSNLHTNLNSGVFVLTPGEGLQITYNSPPTFVAKVMP